MITSTAACFPAFILVAVCAVSREWPHIVKREDRKFIPGQGWQCEIAHEATVSAMKMKDIRLQVACMSFDPKRAYSMNVVQS